MEHFEHCLVTELSRQVGYSSTAWQNKCNNKYHFGLLEAEVGVWQIYMAWDYMSLIQFYVRERGEREDFNLAILFLNMKHVMCVFQKRAVLQDLTELGGSTSNLKVMGCITCSVAPAASSMSPAAILRAPTRWQ